MRLGTKRYFCGGCGASVEGPGKYCREDCVAKARASVQGVAIARDLVRKAEEIRAAGDEPWVNARATLGTKRTDPVLGEIRTLERKKPDFGAALREGLAAAERLERLKQESVFAQPAIRAGVDRAKTELAELEVRQSGYTIEDIRAAHGVNEAFRKVTQRLMETHFPPLFAVAGAIAATAPSVEDARDAMMERQRNAWKRPKRPKPQGP